MKPNEQHQARRLFLQTDLSKTEIADILGISRTTLDAWIADNHWHTLKQCASVMPSQLADNCYRIMGQLTEHILSPEREGKPVTSREVNSLHKLSTTIGKLKTKATLSESMEVFAGFTTYVSNLLPELATSLAPLIDAYIVSQSPAAGSAHQPKINTPQSSIIGTPHAQNTTTARTVVANTGTAAPAPSAGAAEKPKLDLRKALRGTASKGPGKAWREQQARAKAAA